MERLPTGRQVSERKLYVRTYPALLARRKLIARSAKRAGLIRTLTYVVRQKRAIP